MQKETTLTEGKEENNKNFVPEYVPPKVITYNGDDLTRLSHL